MTDYRIESRQIDFYAVHLYVVPILEEARSWPLAGSFAWQRLEESDPKKLAAVLDGGRRDALRNDTICCALAEASHDISTTADWPGVARSIRRRSGVYIPREVA